MLEEVDRMMRRMGWRPKTKQGYRYSLKRFYRWLQERDIPWRRVEEDDVFDWLDEHPHWAPATRHNHVSAIRAFYRWAVGKKNSPAERISIPRPDPGPQRTLTGEEIDKVMASFDTSHLTDIRNLALFVLALDTGMRTTELIRLRIQDLELEARQLKVEVKGGRVARKLFGDYTAHCLQQWLAVRMASSSVEQVFVSLGGPKVGTQLRASSLRTVFYNMAEKAGVRRFSPHVMRRTGATEILRAGASTRAVQLWGDWETLEMAERYSQVLEKDTVRGKLPVDRYMGLADES